jgi:hypothetical protein
MPLDLSTVVSGISIIYEFVILGDGVLYDYNGTVEDVVIPETVKRIGNDAFAYHSEINEITLPESIVEICDGAFYSCTSISKIVLPDSVKNIAVGAFTDCSSLKTVVTGKGIETIDKYAFHSCENLTSFYGYEDTCTAEFAKENGYYFEIVESETAENEEEIAE